MLTFPDKNLATILHATVSATTGIAPSSSGVASNETSPRTCVGMASHAISKTSSTKRVVPDDKLKKRSNQIAKELSDIVIYVQAIKFRGLNTVSPNSSVKQRVPPPRTSSSGSSIMTVCSVTGSSTNVNSGVSSGGK